MPGLQLPLVSIVTVVYNGEMHIQRTIESVIQQTYLNKEYIIIDGGSTDNTLKIVHRYSSGITRWVSESDKGIYDAMNKAIDLCNGQWIIFMNSGDRFYSDNVLMDIFEQNHYGADVIYGDAMIEYPSFQKLWERTDLHNMWKRLPFCHQACFVKVSLMKEHKFSMQFRLSSDFDFFYKIYLAGKKFIYIDQLVCFYDYKEGASIRYKFRSLQERKQAVLSHGFSIKKWFYYFGATVYQRASSFFKKLIGRNLTEWLVRFLRK